MRVLDGLRKQRNLSDYNRESITQSVLQESLNQAETLLAQASKALK